MRALVGDAICGETMSRDIGGGQVGFVLDMLALNGDALGCATNGDAVMLQVLRGSDVLGQVPLIWRNDQIRQVWPSGTRAVNNTIFLPLVTR